MNLPHDNAVLPLAGLLVLDVVGPRPGHSCAQRLADYGADVIRIEDMKSVGKGGEQGVNRNQRGMALDLGTPGGRSILQALARKADVLIHSCPPEVAAGLGVDAAAREKLNPELVVCCVAGDGAGDTASGGSAGLPAFGGVLLALLARAAGRARGQTVSISPAGDRFELTGATPRLRRPAPRHGEHTVEILRAQLAMSEDQIKQLQATGAIPG